ncbi:MAG: hypothetical protein CMK07_15240 [Ponticaulis sp.]|nr:hypothetical protein [Ponticaulis sp.]
MMSSARPFRILYDGECPFCQSYVGFARLRKAVGEVELIDAREAPELVADYHERGFPIDEGMIVDTGDVVYFGGDAVWAINSLVSRNPLLKLMSGRKFLKVIYPSLRFGRNSVIRLLGRKPIQS